MPSESIKVVLRVRPLLRREYGHELCAEQLDQRTLRLFRPAKDDPKKVQEALSRLDCVLDETNQQDDVYREVEKHIMAVPEGLNCTVMAYGQTGTGKTYTMLGREVASGAAGPSSGFAATGQARGIIPRAVEELFAALGTCEDQWETRVTCSFMQVYGDRLYDLLEPLPKMEPWKLSHDNPDRKKLSGLRIQDDLRWGVVVNGLSEAIVNSTEEVLGLLRKGARHRAQRQTEFNEHSSRSHSILQLRLEMDARGGGGTRRSKLNLVDLAGSEKWSDESEMEEDRIKEMAAINKSLTALGSCVNALAMPPGSRPHVPYRNSKLTRLLADGLGGNSRVVLVATVSPSAVSYDETRSTLKFADQARRVMVSARVNDEVDERALKERAEKEIARLKRLLQELTEDEAAQRSHEQVKKLQMSNRSLNKELKESREELESIRRQIMQYESDLRREREAREALAETIRSGEAQGLTSEMLEKVEGMLRAEAALADTGPRARPTGLPVGRGADGRRRPITSHGGEGASPIRRRTTPRTPGGGKKEVLERSERRRQRQMEEAVRQLERGGSAGGGCGGGGGRGSWDISTHTADSKLPEYNPFLDPYSPQYLGRAGAGDPKSARASGGDSSRSDGSLKRGGSAGGVDGGAAWNAGQGLSLKRIYGSAGSLKGAGGVVVRPQGGQKGSQVLKVAHSKGAA